jgi:type IV pilus biogenesis protein CpaD/CtpE
MSKTGSRLGSMVTLLVWCGWVAFSAVSTATLDIQKQAKAAGVDAKNCQYCHVDKLPKKDAGQHDANDVGKWLIAEKEKKGAKAVDGAWLKDYPKK